LRKKKALKSVPFMCPSLYSPCRPSNSPNHRPSRQIYDPYQPHQPAKPATYRNKKKPQHVTEPPKTESYEKGRGIQSDRKSSTEKGGEKPTYKKAIKRNKPALPIPEGQAAMYNSRVCKKKREKKRKKVKGN